MNGIHKFYATCAALLLFGAMVLIGPAYGQDEGDPINYLKCQRATYGCGGEEAINGQCASAGSTECGSSTCIMCHYLLDNTTRSYCVDDPTQNCVGSYLPCGKQATFPCVSYDDGTDRCYCVQDAGGVPNDNDCDVSVCDTI